MAFSPTITPKLRRKQRRRLLLWSGIGVASLIVLLFVLRLRRPPAPLPPLPLAYAYIPSPNVDARPLDMPVSCIVLHATVMTKVEDTVKAFLDPKRKISAHFVIGKQGEVIQMVPVELRAWHAGISQLDGMEHVNDYSVGIEMVNRNDGKDPYTEAQMLAVAGIIRFVRSRYAIPDARLVSHAEIALPSGRKNDPTGFDFARIRALAR